MAHEKIGDPAEVTALVRQENVGGISTLFGSDNPDLAMSRMSAVARTLAAVIESRKMYTMIGAGKHVRVEGWQTLGALVGVFPVVVWCRRVENGWEARVEARTRYGETVGAAEAECLNTEKNWAVEPHVNKYGKTVDGKEDHHLRSMAQTRAVSKALSMPLRFIIALAGYEGTPAEEMPATPADGVFKGERAGRKVSQPSEKTSTEAPPAPVAPASAPATPADPSLKTWTGKVDNVLMREGTNKNGKPYKLFTIKGRDGSEFKTFSETHATDAKVASGSDLDLTIRYAESEFKGRISFEAREVFPAEDNEPGAEG